MKSSDPHAVLATLINNNGNLKEKQVEEYQRLRLDLWDMPGSASSSGITQQVLIKNYIKARKHYFHIFKIDIFIGKSNLFTCI